LRLLVDTHTILWWLNDDRRLGAKARDLIADQDNEVLVSAVSLWEIVVKVRIGKLTADVAEIANAIKRDGFATLSITTAHLSTLSSLPRHSEHRDPFDHLLIAQAIVEDATFVSEDRRATLYPIRVVACSAPT
jgi:PIN domain nuclease of toxin-antitoxin system